MHRAHLLPQHPWFLYVFVRHPTLWRSLVSSEGVRIHVARETFSSERTFARVNWPQDEMFFDVLVMDRSRNPTDMWFFFFGLVEGIRLEFS